MGTDVTRHGTTQLSRGGAEGQKPQLNQQSRPPSAAATGTASTRRTRANGTRFRLLQSLLPLLETRTDLFQAFEHNARRLPVGCLHRIGGPHLLQEGELLGVINLLHAA